MKTQPDVLSAESLSRRQQWSFSLPLQKLSSAIWWVLRVFKRRLWLTEGKKCHQCNQIHGSHCKTGLLQWAPGHGWHFCVLAGGCLPACTPLHVVLVKKDRLLPVLCRHSIALVSQIWSGWQFGSSSAHSLRLPEDLSVPVLCVHTKPSSNMKDINLFADFELRESSLLPEEGRRNTLTSWGTKIILRALLILHLESLSL